MSSALAYPSARTKKASLIIGNRMRLTTNPGALLTVMGDLPSCTASAAAASCIASLVSSPRTISTSDMTETGLKKCKPTTRSGCDIEDASLVMDTDEVLEATMESALTSASTCLKILVLRS